MIRHCTLTTSHCQSFLPPAYGEVPAVAAVGGFAQDGLVLVQFAQDFGAFAAELVGIGFDCLDEGLERVEAVLAGDTIAGAGGA